MIQPATIERMVVALESIAASLRRVADTQAPRPAPTEPRREPIDEALILAKAKRMLEAEVGRNRYHDNRAPEWEDLDPQQQQQWHSRAEMALREQQEAARRA